MKLFILFLLSLICLKLFEFQFLKVSSMLVLFIIAIGALRTYNIGDFRYYLYLLFVCLIVNITTCYFLRGQTVMESLPVYDYLFGIYFYFVLQAFSVNAFDMEKIILWLVVLFCICYLIQYVAYPFAIFGNLRDDFESETRIRMMGQGLSSLGFFYGINKMLTTKSRRAVFLSALCFIIILLMSFRTMMVGLIICSIIMIWRIRKSKVLIFSLIFTAAAMFFLAGQFSEVFSERVSYMLEKNSSQSFADSDYIRWLSLDYYLHEHFINGWEYFLGSGQPSLDSTYGAMMFSILQSHYGYMDWGLLGLSWIIGIPAVLIMIGYSIKAIKINIPIEFLYLKIWFIYLLVISVTTAEFFRPGNFVIQAIVLYMIQRLKISGVDDKYKKLVA